MLPPPWGENDLDKAGEWLESNIELIEQWLRQRASNNLIKRLHEATISPTSVSDNTNGITTPQLPIVKVKDSNNHGSPRTRSSLSPEDVISKPPPRKQSQTSTLSFSPESSLEIYREVSNHSKISIFQIPSPDVLDPEGSRRTSTNSNISITHSSPSPPPCETVIENFKFYNSSSRSTSPETTSQWDQPHLPVTVQPSSNNILSCDSAAAIAISSRRTSIASCHLVHTSSQSSFTQQQGSSNAGNKTNNAASRRTSITSDLFQIWLAASPVKASASGTLPTVIRDLTHLDESELFMELIRDVANELDLDVLCHKILVNICILTHADRGSLFLARGPADNRFLIAKLFDVTRDTELEDAVHKARTEELRIPFGVGIAGTVAQTKEIINIKNAYEDPRFNSDVDMRTGYKTNLILCMPICNYEGDVIGVAQIINKTNESEEFTDHDVEIFQRYLTFCGIGIQNAQLFEVSVLEYRRNQILLNLARSIFEEQNNLECLVTKIMTEAQELLKCERCAVFLLDLDCCEANHLERIIERPTGGRALPEQHKPLSRRESGSVTADDMRSVRGSGRSVFTTVFELREAGPEAVVTRPTVADLQNSTLAQIASYVANTGQILNIGDVKGWLKTSVAVDAETVSARTILCMPIVNAQKHVIGVAQLINKANGQLFTDCDVSLFEAFAIFCGLGIHNTQMYESACKLMAKQKVALECLSYHATASNDATMQLTRETIPSAETYNLYSFTFIDFDLSDDDTCRATVRMFLQCNLVQQFHIPYDVLCRWILSVRKNYRPVKYHNWRHALNVAQTMFAMLKTGKMERFMTDLEILGLLVACLCHDLDHRGTNNAFQTKTESPLAILYTTSTMEHHHFDQCVMILNSDCNNIFQALSPDDYKKVMKIVETAILSTDLAMYFKKKNKFLELIDNGEFDWQSEDKKELLCGMMMTACDVSAIAKPWEVQHRVAKLVADEFFDQGDLERLQLKQEPVAMMDRERKDELPQMQVGFIDVICLPLYKVLTETFPWMEPLYKGTLENRKNWQDLAEKVEMGLTWIDHDTIDKPIETLAEAEAVKELEFTVTTLHQQNTAINSNDATVKSTAVASLISNQRNRMQSIKTKSLTRVVRARLTKSLYGASSLAGTAQPSSSTVYSNIVGENSSPSAHTATVPSPNVAPSTPKSKPKNRSKLCSIL